MKIGHRWNRKGTKKGSGSVEKVTQGAPERSKVGEGGKLWERWRGGEEPRRPANKNAEETVKAVRERTKLVPQFLEEVKINSISEEGWLGGRSGRGKKGEEVRKERKRRKTVRMRRKVGMPRRRKT